VAEAGLRVMCRHCGIRKAARPRGLCWIDYYTPGVRDLYPSTSKFCRRGVGNRNHRRPAATPTQAPPGSEEKILILIARAGAGEQLFHADDLVAKPLQGERTRRLARGSHLRDMQARSVQVYHGGSPFHDL
jgi:hypothetical protein